MHERWLQIPVDRSTLLIGARRAGKTTLLRHMLPDVPYFTLDDYDVLSLARKDPKALVATLGTRGILDEIQRVPELLIAVKFGIDNEDQVIHMTGSSTIGLLAGGTETLAGRIAPMECPTFCWGEEMGKPTHACFETPPDPFHTAKAYRHLDDAQRFGGFPEARLAESTERKMAVLRNYKNSYFTKDLLLLANIQDADALMAILAYLTISSGSPLQVSNVSREAGVSHATAKKYLNVLIASRLAFRLYGYHYGPAKRFTRAAKIYFADAGLPTALGIEMSAGQRLEAFVVSELEKRRQLGAFDCDRLYYFRSTGGAEVDVIIDEPKRITAIEIKHSRNPSWRDARQLRRFLEQMAIKTGGKPTRGVLLHLGEQSEERDGVRMHPIANLWRAR